MYFELPLRLAGVAWMQGSVPYQGEAQDLTCVRDGIVRDCAVANLRRSNGCTS